MNITSVTGPHSSSSRTNQSSSAVRSFSSGGKGKLTGLVVGLAITSLIISSNQAGLLMIQKVHSCAFQDDKTFGGSQEKTAIDTTATSAAITSSASSATSVTPNRFGRQSSRKCTKIHKIKIVTIFEIRQTVRQIVASSCLHHGTPPRSPPSLPTA